ncbi:MAG: hypothetical protein M3O36_17060 [Myxococcota bacterium]|nr:hypothetical protein [Myxococcota bacterium]
MRDARSFVPMALLGAVACETESPTTVVVDNDYSVVPDGGNPATLMTVFKVWWVTSLMPDAVGPGGEGQSQRTVPNADFAYALIAPGWDPSSSTPPSRLFAARSAIKLSVARGDALHVHVADETFTGNCAAGKPLSQDDADFVTQRVFPGEFVGLAYDATTCSVAPQLPAADAGQPDQPEGAAADSAPGSNGSDAGADSE